LSYLRLSAQIGGECFFGWCYTAGVMKNYLPKFLSLVLFSLMAVAAADNINIKPGLWETTTVSQSQGAPAIPPEQQAQMDKMRASMSPEMRARIEAAQKKAQANAGAPHVRKSCLTREDLNKPLSFDEGKDDGKCTKTVLKSTASVQEVRVDCKGDRYNSTGTIRVTASNSENWSGTLETTLTPVGKGAPMTVKTNMSGKWLGADCGDVKPVTHK
jgi:hypothetical protein